MKNQAIIIVDRISNEIRVGFSLTGTSGGNYPLSRDGLEDLKSDLAADDLCEPKAQENVEAIRWDDLSCLDEIEIDLGNADWKNA